MQKKKKKELAFEFRLEKAKKKPFDSVEWDGEWGDIPNKEKSKCRNPKKE